MINKIKNMKGFNTQMVKQSGTELINGKELWKYFFTNQKKNYNMYMYEMINYPEYLMYDNEKVDTYKGNWNDWFKNDNDIYLEIGCGSGNFTVQNAEKFKNRNYVALELRFKRLVMGARKSKKRHLKNIVFLRKRAETIMDFFGENELSGVYINFPDPWEGEERKRVINEELFKRLDVLLKKEGKIFFKTDHEVYYNDVLDLVDNLNNYEIVFHTRDLHNSEKSHENILTEFEQMFLSKHNMNIKYIEILKK